MQTLTVNSKYDVSNNLIDYDLLYKELELCFKTGGKTYYVRPKAFVANQFYNEKGKAIKRQPACWKYYEDVFEKRYSKTFVDAMSKRGFECRDVCLYYIDRKNALHHDETQENEFLLFVEFDYNRKKQSILDFQKAWEEEIKNLFPTACMFRFEDNVTQTIAFTIPEFA